MEDPVVTAQRRAAGYWNIDGLPELYIGFVWLCVPLFLYASTHLPKSSSWYRVLIVGGIVGLMAAIMGSQWVLGAMKRRVTYPRTGYVAYEKPKSKSVLWFPVLMVPLLLALPFAPQRLVLSLTGMLFAIISIGVGRSMGAKRSYWFGGFMCALGIALGFANLDVGTGLALIFGAAGAALMISGGWRLWHYLEQA